MRTAIVRTEFHQEFKLLFRAHCLVPRAGKLEMSQESGRLSRVGLGKMQKTLARSVLWVLCVFLHSALYSVVASAAASSKDAPSLLELKVGLNLSIRASLIAIGNASIATYGDGAFLPILSSPGFNSANSSERLGFSLGFFFSRSPSSADNSQDIYLAVCGGLSGNYSNLTGIVPFPYLSGSDDLDLLDVWTVADGYAMPVWIANLDSPLRSVNSSLVVAAVPDVQGGANRELQLRDQNGSVVWNVTNVGMMEMNDMGNLVIYDTMSRTNLVWQSSRDTLLQRQKLTVGKELRSNDSSYLARMEKGGLVLYLNNAQFIEQPPSSSPYWVIPILLSNATDVLDLNTLASSSPCSPNDAAYSTLDDQYMNFVLSSGPCSNMTSFIIHLGDDSETVSWSFIKLENDGRLYAYAVSSMTSPPSIDGRYPLDNGDPQVGSYDPTWFQAIPYAMPYVSWRECDVPMPCGPLGLCSPGAASLCACPYSSPDGINFFHPINTTDFSKGCTRLTHLPPCSRGDEHINTTDFLQVDQTASIFQFGGWAFNSTSVPVDDCKRFCLFNCSCNGFIYQAINSTCFFITNEISLLNINSERNLTSMNSSDLYGVGVPLEIFPKNYVTYLKVASTTQNNLTIGSNPAASPIAPGSKHILIIAIPVLSSFLVCLVLGLAVYLFSARNSRHSQMSRQAKEEELELQDILPLLPRRFSYRDLHEATKAFSKLLGAGGCGSVYAGVLQDGRRIAVKMLESSLLKGAQSRQFLAEVVTIGRTSHHNIVRLVGFCWEVSHRLLVYEYVERGSLDHWLFAEGAADGAPTAPALLNWQTRYNVALGIARGLSYLHEECTQPILHFDIKPQNILLDGEFVAKLADFGMSRLMQRDVSEVVTGVRGTPGYIAPEWLSYGAVSKKSDVYSMGMVMLEIVGGRRNVDLALLNSAFNPQEWHFPSWAARKCEQGLMMELVDKRLQICGFDEEQAQRLIHAAFWCIHENPSMRPCAPMVVQWLEGSSPVKEPPFSTAAAQTQCPAEPTS